MSLAASPQKESVATPEIPETGGLTLRLFDGIHVGAERALAEGETVVIGCGDDCDVILSDAGVAVHHCYLGVRDGVMSLRAMDAPARVDGEVLRPGDPRVLEPFAMVNLGSASFAAGPRWSEQWRNVARGGVPQQSGSGQRSTSLRWAMWLLGLGLLAIVAGWYWSSRTPHSMTSAEEQTRAAGIIQSLKLKGVDVEPLDKDGHLQVSGIVAKPEDVAALRSALSSEGLDDIKFAVRDGPSIAADLQQQLQMADPPVKASTRWLGARTILVSGHFGDGKALDLAFGSRSMQDLNAQYHLRVARQNLDRLQPGFQTPPQGKEIATIVEDDPPYLVTTDQSRYYVGSTLPQGGIFAGLDGGQLLVRDQSGSIRRFDLSKVAPGASIVDDQAEVQDERQ